MNKTEFLGIIKDGISGLPQADIDERLAFYSEMIDDRVEEGLTEEEAVADAGSPEEIIKQIIADYPLNKIVREKMKPSRSLKGWEIVLIILGFPLWFPLLAAAFAVVLSLYVCVWAVVISLWAVEVSLIACVPGGIAAAVLFFTRGQVLQAVALLGAAIFLAGFSILFFIICKTVSKGVLELTKKVMRSIKSRFIRRRPAQ